MQHTNFERQQVAETVFCKVLDHYLARERSRGLVLDEHTRFESAGFDDLDLNNCAEDCARACQARIAFPVSCETVGDLIDLCARGRGTR